MKILFTHTYFLTFDKKQLELSKPYPPLATILAASYIRENGFEVSLFDTNYILNPNEIEPVIENYLPEVLVIYDDGFNYLTKMCLTNMREAAFEMIKIAKANNIPVIVSSSDSTDHYEAYLKKGADVIILGEAEETLLELVTLLKAKKNIFKTEGIAFQNPNNIEEIIKTPLRKIRVALDKLPLPAWDLIKIETYKKAWKKHNYFSINIATTRGCPYKCNWCAKPIYGNRYNSRSPKHVVSELKLIKSLFDFDHIWFCDDIFGLKPNWIAEFNVELKKENINLRYKIQSRADLLLQDETIKSLAESGCEEVWIGAESGSQEILDAMDKNTTVEQIVESTQLMKKHGIKPCYFLQFGYLDETWKDIKLTNKLLFSNMPFDIGVSVSYPLPGTKFYDKVAYQLDEKANWVDSDELLLMFENTYKPIFYKKLHTFIHKRFRQKQIENDFSIVKLPKWGYFKLISNLLYFKLLIMKTKA